MKILKIILIILVAMQGFLFNPELFAEGEEAPAVIINEIAWAGSSRSINDEFIELFNTTDSDINLSDWQIKGAATGGENLILPASSTIPALGFFVVANYLPDNDKSALAIAADYVTPSISLANSDAEYILEDAENNVIDQADDGSGAPLNGDNETKASMARKPGCWDGGLEECWFGSITRANLKEGVSDLSTPGADNAWEEPIINQAPFAAIDAPATAEVNMEIIFDGQDSSDPDEDALTYQWRLNNEETATTAFWITSFSEPATHEVSLTVSDGELEHTATHAIVIFPEPEPPYEPAPDDLIINEFVPSPDDAKEWVEIYNPSDIRIELSGWELWDGKSKIISLDGTIAPDEYLVAELKSAKLNNSGDRVILKFDEVIISAVTYGDWEDEDISDNEPCPGQAHALARPFGADNFAITITPTPGEKNIITPIPEPEPMPESEVIVISAPAPEPEPKPEPIPTPSFNPGDLIINEFVSDPPTGGVEWVEIYNPNASAITLDNWQLTDASNSKTALSGEIGPGKYLVVYSPKGKLNNGEDTISLIGPSNNLIDSITYGYELPAPPKGTGLARDTTGAWLITNEPTPGGANAIVLPDSESEPNEDESHGSNTTGAKTADKSSASADKTVSYLDAKFENMDEWQEKQNISIIGIVTALPGALGQQYFYIGDNAGRGLQVYNYKKEFPDLDIGDEVYVQGELSKTNEMWRLKTKTSDDIATIGNDEAVAEPIGTDEIDYEFFAGLVSLAGRVTEFKSGQLYLDDGNGDILIKFSKSNALENIKLGIDDEIRAQGILVNAKSGYYIETRLADDIEIINQQTIEEAPAETKRSFSNYAGLIPLGILMVAGIANLKKLKKLVKK